MQHAAVELKKQGSRHVYAFVTHGLFSSPDSAEKIIQSPIKELVTTNTVRMRPQIERIEKVRERKKQKKHRRSRTGRTQRATSELLSVSASHAFCLSFVCFFVR